MSYKAERAIHMIKGFDTNTKLNADLAARFKEAGYQFCLRYLSRLEAESPNDLSSDEVNEILEAGLALMPVQHVQRPNWQPSGELGKTYGLHAAEHAREVGILPGVNVWLDLEGVFPDTPKQEVVNYCNAWHQEVFNAGYNPGLYVGSQAILSGEEFYTLLPFSHYWKSLSRVPDVAKRGYQMIQWRESKAFGIDIDEDYIQLDHLGGSVIWMIK